VPRATATRDADLRRVRLQPLLASADSDYFRRVLEELDPLLADERLEPTRIERLDPDVPHAPRRSGHGRTTGTPETDGGRPLHRDGLG